MSITINAKGTSVPFFTIGKNGTTLYQGTIDPSLFYSVKNGDMWVDPTENTLRSWSTTSSSWVAPKIADLDFSANSIIASASEDLTLKTTSGNKIILDAGTGTPVITSLTGKDLHITEPLGGDLYLNVNKWVAGDGTSKQVLSTDGSGNLGWVNNGFKSVVTKAESYSVQLSDSVILVNGAYTITLPSASTAGNGANFTIKRIGTGTVTIDSTSGNIDNNSSIQITTQYEYVTVVSDGSNWWKI